jgi:hypothetical protein
MFPKHNKKEKHNSCEMRWKSMHVAKIRGNKGTGALFFCTHGLQFVRYTCALAFGMWRMAAGQGFNAQCPLHCCGFGEGM